MNLFQAFILGLVQGATEYIPVSSSAHLVLVPWFLGWPNASFAFEVLVQWGTLVGVFVFFWQDIWAITKGVIEGLLQGKPVTTFEARLGWLVLVATLPAVVLGLLFKSFFEAAFASPAVAGGLLILTALLLTVAERYGAPIEPADEGATPTREVSLENEQTSPPTNRPRPSMGVGTSLQHVTDPHPNPPPGRRRAERGCGPRPALRPEEMSNGSAVGGRIFKGDRKRGRELEHLTWLDSIIIGFWQAAAILPGISRSGSTIGGAVLRNFNRTAAARFSFLMSIPALLGAGVVALKDLLEAGSPRAELLPISIGFIAAAVSGYACIRWLLHYLQRHSLYIFAAYCAVISVISIILATVRG